MTGYALLINQRYPTNPVRYCLLTNGLITELLRWDSNVPELVMRFAEFDPGDANFAALRSAISYEVFNQEEAIRGVRPAYHRPTVSEIVGVFARAHNLIWKKEKYGPTKAFYELAKLLFVKLQQDRRIHDVIAAGRQPSAGDFYFRGKELGQFFTPRPVVKYMAKTARLRLADRELPRVIDACCGSGGFLIEALAELSFAINNREGLTNTERDELLGLVDDCSRSRR